MAHRRSPVTTQRATKEKTSPLQAFQPPQYAEPTQDLVDALCSSEVG